MQHHGTKGAVIPENPGLEGIHAPVQKRVETAVPHTRRQEAEILVRVPAHAEPLTESPVDAADSPAFIRKIHGHGQRIHEGAQKGQLVLDAQLHRLALPDVDHQDRKSVV